MRKKETDFDHKKLMKGFIVLLGRFHYAGKKICRLEND